MAKKLRLPIVLTSIVSLMLILLLTAYVLYNEDVILLKKPGKPEYFKTSAAALNQWFLIDTILQPAFNIHNL